MNEINRDTGNGVIEEMTEEIKIGLEENLNETAVDHRDLTANEDFPQTDSENSESITGPIRPAEEKVSQEDFQNQSDGVTDAEEEEIRDTADEAPEKAGSRAPVRLTSRILSIDDQLAVQTQEEKAKNDFLDLLESYKTGHILTGTIQGIERPEAAGEARAVIYHGDIKVLIPASQLVEPPNDFRGRLPEDVMHYMITKRLGAEVDYIVKGLDPDAGFAVASRLEAMRAKRKEYYFGQDRNGNFILHSDICAEARVVSVIRAGIFVDLFGQEVYIPLRELSYQRMMDAAKLYQPGQRIIVKTVIESKMKLNLRVNSVAPVSIMENCHEDKSSFL